MFEDITSFKKNTHLINLDVLKTIFLIILFITFVVPYSFSISGEGVSGNYMFVLFPIIFYITKFWNRSEVNVNEITRPSNGILFYMLLLFSIFFASIYSQPEFSQFLFRRTASFLAFMSIFAFMFVKVDKFMVRSFKYAIIIYSVYASLESLIIYLNLGGADLGTYAKGKVGSNRIGFIYILALWISLHLNSKTFLLVILKHLLATILIIGLLLTFSRSSLLALFSSMVAYFLIIVIKHFLEKRPFKSLLKNLINPIIYVVFVSLFLGSLFPNTIVQGNRLIFEYLTPQKVSNNISYINNSNNTSIMINSQDQHTQDQHTQDQLTQDQLTQDRLTQEQNHIYLNSKEENTSIKMLDDISNPTSSIGYRVFLTNKVINFVLDRPFNGSGFLGVWIILEKVDGNYKGSAHGQYVDVFFRVGFLGFLIYIFYTYRISIFLFKKDPGLFLGFIGMIFYGFFHETFKLSQGAFVFAFLFALYDQNKHILKIKTSAPSKNE